MGNAWTKIILHSVYATFAFIFLAMFLSALGISVFSDYVFSGRGIAVVFVFMAFNVFAMIYW